MKMFFASLFFLVLSFSCGNNEKQRTFAAMSQVSCLKKCAIDNLANYLSESQRQQYILQIKDGLFSFLDNSVPDGSGIYVLSPEKVFYFVKLKAERDRTFFHSYFLAGNPVLGAGWMTFSNGKLVYIDNSSGHYQPSTKHFFQTLRVLALRKVDISSVKTLIH